MSLYRGRWYGKKRYFGLHYDLHANPKDTEIGQRATPQNLVPMFERVGADFVQTDSKGHPGYTSWYSKLPDASVCPGLKKDALEGWRAATRELGLPLTCHYSGLFDEAIGTKHPEWGMIDRDGRPIRVGHPMAGETEEAFPQKMCPRSPYLEEFMLPQLFEMIDRYDIDGLWVDGEVWAVEPCYCERCRQAFREAEGTAPPTESTDPSWASWFAFTRKGFEDYVTRYCEAVRAHKPEVLVCSNYLQTFRNPGEPRVPTDWISHDKWVFGLDDVRCEVRFVSTRRKPWDVMLWSFYWGNSMGGDPASPPVFKSVQHLQQEAASVLALGGNLQVYDNSDNLRDGQLVPWRMERVRQVGRFAKARRTLCQDTETIPQVVVLHSEVHTYAHPGGGNLMYGIDTAPVQGAVSSLLSNLYGVDIMDEWALEQCLRDFPVVVAPEQDCMSDDMVSQLKDYVESGGRLLVSGAAALERFGAKFLGVTRGGVEEDASYHLPAADGSFVAHSKTWQLLNPSTARELGRLGTTPLLDARLQPHPAATLNRVGQGAVAYIPCDIFRFFRRHRHPLACAFIGEVVGALAGRLAIRVSGPAGVDVVLRRQGKKSLVHLINTTGGAPNRPHDGIEGIPAIAPIEAEIYDEVLPVGPIKVKIQVKKKPKRVGLAFEKGTLKWKYRAGQKGGQVTARIEQVHIHAALVIEP